MLTLKQHELLIFITERLSQSGVSPSFDEMKAAIGLNSKSGIHRLLGGLEERGFIRRHHRRARAIEVLRLPDGSPVSGSVAETVRRSDETLANDRELAEAIARVNSVANGMGISREDLIAHLSGKLAGGRRG